VPLRVHEAEKDVLRRDVVVLHPLRLGLRSRGGGAEPCGHVCPTLALAGDGWQSLDGLLASTREELDGDPDVREEGTDDPVLLTQK
jgi:hypothetical protein